MFLKSNLVFVFNNNLDKNWIENKSDYNLIIVNSKSSNKWHDIAKIYDKYKFLMFFYKTISFVDGEIVISKKNLSEYFNIFKKYELNIASPSYKFSTNIFFRKNPCYLRYVNCFPTKFITFNFSSIRTARQHLLANESGSGIEWVLPKLFEYKGICIVDSVYVENEYKEKQKNIKDLVKIFSKYDIESFNNVEFSRLEHEEEKCWCCYIDVSSVNKCIFKRPTRRSNGCCESVPFLSNRMMSSTRNNIN